MYSHGIQAILARSIAGGEGEVGEKVQGSLANLGVAGVGLEMVGGGSSTTEQRRRRCASKFGELQRALSAMAGLDSSTGGQARRDAVRPGQCRGGGGSSARHRVSSARKEEAEQGKW